MWSQTFKESVLDLVNKPAPWVEWGQAFLFLAYGLVILATGCAASCLPERSTT